MKYTKNFADKLPRASSNERYFHMRSPCSLRGFIFLCKRYSFELDHIFFQQINVPKHKNRAAYFP